MEQPKGWTRISDESGAEELLALTDSFHDGVVLHAAWSGAEFVNAKRELVFGGLGSLELTVDSQFEDVPRIELRFGGVREFRYSHKRDFHGVVTLEPQGVVAKLLTWEVVAEELAYRVVASTAAPIAK